MDISNIRQDIETAVRHEDEHGAFRAIVVEVVRREQPDKTDDEIQTFADKAVAGVREFVVSAPTVIEATLQAAEEAGVLERVQPIFETALQYTEEELDFIPDSLGLAGLMDDAYLIYGLMQEISERHRVLVGTSLLPAVTFSIMQDIKRMIGDPTATRLEMAIVAFARRQNVRETIEQIYRRIGSEGLAMDMPSSAKMPGERSPLADVPCLDLGRRWTTR